MLLNDSGKIMELLTKRYAQIEELEERLAKLESYISELDQSDQVEGEVNAEAGGPRNGDS